MKVGIWVFVLVLYAASVDAFNAPVGCKSAMIRRASAAPALTLPQMGIFDAISKAFANKPFDNRSARASHILFKGKNAKGEASKVKAQIEAGELKFADAARSFSQCPSKAKGGSLGQFSPGQMVPAFDKIVFDDSIAIGDITIVDTQFGTHLVKVETRA